MGKIIGIDYGTTTSSVAHHDGVTTRLFETPDGDRIMPSVVAITEDGKVHIGQAALNELSENAEFTYQHIKGQLGEVWNENEDQGFQTIESINGWVAYIGPGGKTYLPEELTALILGELKAMAEEGLREIVTGAVVTVPSDCSEAQRKATIDAAHEAGFETVETLVEPMAAAMAYGYGKDGFYQPVVYDLGGGTFDIAFMDIRDGVCREIKSLGIDHLGGRDFDERITDFVVDKFLEENRDSLTGPLHDAKLTEVQFHAEKAKKVLSTNDVGRIRVTFVARDKDRNPLHLNHDLTIQEFEGLCHDFIDQTIDACERCMKLAERDLQGISDVLLVGGMTRVPAVRKAVEDFFGVVPTQRNPDTIVAEGAALKAAQLDQSIDLSHESTAAASYGLVNPDHSVRTLLPRGTKFGTEKSFKLTTSYDGQPSLKIIIVRGDEGDATDNELIEIVDHPVKAGKKGKVSVPLKLTLTPEGLLETQVGG